MPREHVRRYRRRYHICLPVTMSNCPSTSTPSSDFRTIFIAAMKAYEKKTMSDILTHPLATQLQACNSSSDVLTVLLNIVNDFDKSRCQNERLSSWLNPTINVLYAFSATLGQGVGLVSLDFDLVDTLPPIFIIQIFSPANIIFAGIGILFLVRTFLGRFVEAFSTVYVRQPRRSTRVKKRLPPYSSVSRTSSSALNPIPMYHQVIR